MKLKGLVEYDISNYKKPSMFVIFPSCTFKCDKECGQNVCQNSQLAFESEVKINTLELVQKYINNPLTKALVCGGLEPFDSWDDLRLLVEVFRSKTDDDIVIYTGYTSEEQYSNLLYLRYYPNIIIKFGRFIPNQESHYDEVLGVNLASPNQYAEVIS